MLLCIHRLQTKSRGIAWRKHEIQAHYSSCILKTIALILVHHFISPPLHQSLSWHYQESYNTHSLGVHTITCMFGTWRIDNYKLPLEGNIKTNQKKRDINMNNIIILIFCDTFCVLWDFVHSPEAYSYRAISCPA